LFFGPESRGNGVSGGATNTVVGPDRCTNRGLRNAASHNTTVATATAAKITNTDTNLSRVMS
jgi:hypothetical protein